MHVTDKDCGASPFYLGGSEPSHLAMLTNDQKQYQSLYIAYQGVFKSRGLANNEAKAGFTNKNQNTLAPAKLKLKQENLFAKGDRNRDCKEFN